MTATSLAEKDKTAMRQGVRPLEHTVRCLIPDGPKIRAAREMLGMGQRALAAKAGVSLNSISLAENDLCDGSEILYCIRLALLHEMSGWIRQAGNATADVIMVLAKGDCG